MDLKIHVTGKSSGCKISVSTQLIKNIEFLLWVFFSPLHMFPWAKLGLKLNKLL